jgi:hypothetical protein
MMKIRINGNVQSARHKNSNKGIWSLFLIWAIQRQVDLPMACDRRILMRDCVQRFF